MESCAGPSQTTAADDANAVRRVLSGDREAFEELVQRHQAHVRVAMCALLGDRELAEDVAQEAFLLAYRCLSQLKQPQQFGAWLGKIARNVGLRRAKRESRKGPSLEALRELSVQVPDPSPPPGEAEKAAEGRHATYLAAIQRMDSIPEPYRQTLIDKYVRGLTCAAIAENSGTAVGTVTSRLSRGVGLLREALEKDRLI